MDDGSWTNNNLLHVQFSDLIEKTEDDISNDPVKICKSNLLTC